MFQIRCQTQNYAFWSGSKTTKEKETEELETALDEVIPTETQHLTQERLNLLAAKS